MTDTTTAPGTSVPGAVPFPAQRRPRSGSKGRRRNKPSGDVRARKVARLIVRDGNACFYCGTAFTAEVPPTLDHVRPLKVRRTWADDALVLACEPCNHVKDGTEPHQVLAMLGMPGLSKRAARTLEPAALLEVFRPVRGRFRPGFQPTA